MNAVKSVNRPLLVSAVAILAVLAIALSAIPADAADGEQEYDKDLGDFYSYKVHFQFDGTDAQKVEWDFGDGTPVVEGFSVDHMFPKVDDQVYYVTQTATNDKGPSTEVYKVTIKGFPEITFVDNEGGTSTPKLNVGNYNVTAEKPADPERDGYIFDGWYFDPECEEKVDWSTQKWVWDTTVYAKWIEIPAGFLSVILDADGGILESNTLMCEEGSSVELPAPTWDAGHTFMHWVAADGTEYDAGDDYTPAKNGEKLTAVWDITYLTVTADLGYDDVTKTYTVEYGKTLAFVEGYAAPEREGYTFAGWELSGAAFATDTPVTTDLLIVAIWDVADKEAGDDSGDSGESDLLWLILAILLGIIAVACLFATTQNTYFAIGTVVSAILAVVCALIYGGIL